ncbi:MAG: PBP1A family penicillin-binding protein [Bryobacteraceae bacterium]
MGVSVKVPKGAGLVRFFIHPAGKILISLAALVLVSGLGTFVYFYVHYARLIDQRLATGAFANTSRLYATPAIVQVGDEMTASETVAQLRQSGYSARELRSNRIGWFNRRSDDAVEIFPGAESYFPGEDAVIKFSGRRVKEIISLRDNSPRTQYWLEPEILTNLFDRNREKRRLVRYEDIPKVVVDAVISAEDKRFFQHAGFDPLRIVKSAFEDVKKGYMHSGASTLTMQLARSLWLNQDKTLERKAAEVLITMHLEQKLTKQEIFEYYANQIDLGRHRSFAVHGFGEGAQVYFGKDLQQLTLPEAAMLAGLVNRPNFLNPYRHPERARDRRDKVLKLMRENGLITDREYAKAITAPVTVAPGGAESTDAPYFVDLVNDELQENFADHDFQTNSYRVYTTLDMNLQREAVEAVRIGMKEVDDQLRAKRRGKPLEMEPQVALVAIDPTTGEIKALIGGRNYGNSQLDRAVSKRQPGSVFKPFVYAAAMSSALDENAKTVLTPESTVVDEPTTFWFESGTKSYEPNNFKDEYHGTVTLRQAMTKSLNIPTIKTAEAVGYDKVANLARQLGLNAEPTPAIALGSYDNSPIDVAGAYTVFPNGGLYVKPNWIRAIRDADNRPIFDVKPVRKQVLDPRVAYIMVTMLEDVMRSGTAAGTRARGFGLPAGGKTGTSRDGWFAGFTSRLLCVVYVGFDDSTDIKLEGARSALPVWTEFMKRAHKYREYRSVRQFEAPDGLVTVDVDPTTGQLASAGCPSVKPDVFILGTQPMQVCQLHGGMRQGTHVAGWEANPGEIVPTIPANPSTASSVAGDGRVARRPMDPAAPDPQSISIPPPPKEKPKEKRGFFGKVRDIFR